MKFTAKRIQSNEEQTSQSPLHTKAFVEELDQLYKNLFLSVPSSFLCATIVFIALFRIPHTSALIYWFGAVIVLSLLRVLQAYSYISDQICSRSRFNIFLVMTTLSAALWGVAGSLLMPNQFHVEQMIVMVVLAGVAAGGVQSLQPSLIASLIYTNVLILPLACWVFLQGTVSYSILGISVLLYLLFNLSISLRGHKFLKNTIKLKYKNINLAENLTDKNHQLQEVNEDIREKENNLRLIHDYAPIGMAIVSIDGHWLNVNNKLCDIVGYSKDELENLTIQDITFQEDLQSDLENQKKLLAGKLQSYHVEKRYINKNNQLIWIVTNVSLVRNEKGEPLYYISQIQDINDKKQHETTIAFLSKMNAMLQLCRDSFEAYSIISNTAAEIFTNLSGGLAIFNKLTNQQETVGTWGEQSLLKPNFNSEDCWAFRSGNTYIVHDPKKDALCSHYNEKPASTAICLPLLVQSQVLGMLNFNAHPGQEITSYQQEVINNFSEIIKLSLSNIQLKEVLSEQAIHDPLTELLNRRYLYDLLPQLMQHIIQSDQILCICMIDIDFFKQINDQYGHDAGDEVLKYVGALLKKSLRDSDVTFRYGGEEFVVILNGSDLEHATMRMEQIREAIMNAQISKNNRKLPSITVSIGIAQAPMHGKTINEILRAADSALYIAKETGRNRIVNFDFDQLNPQSPFNAPKDFGIDKTH